MPLQDVAYPIEFAGGVDTKTDPKRVLPTKLLVLENGVFTKGKKIQKRNGYTNLGVSVLGGGALTESNELALFDSELLQFSSNKLYSYSEQTMNWVDKGACYSISNTNASITRNSYQQSGVDFAVCNNIHVYVYQDSSTGGVKMTVTDKITGSVIQSNTALAAVGVNPRVATVGNYVLILYVTTTNLICRIFNVLEPQNIGPEITLETNVKAADPFVDIKGLDNVALFAYCTSVGTNSIRVGYLTKEGVVGSPTTGFPNVVTIGNAVTGALEMLVDSFTGSPVLFFSNTTDGTAYHALNADFTTRQATTIIDADTTYPALRIAPYQSTATAIGCLYEKATASGLVSDHYILGAGFDIVSGAPAPAVLVRSAGIASETFSVSGDNFVIIVHDSPLQATYFLMRFDGLLCSKMQPGQAGGLITSGTIPYVFVENFKAYFPAIVKTKVVSQNNTTFTINGVSLETINFASPARFQTRQISGNLLVTGGLIQSYDGSTLCEAGFSLYPEGVQLTPANSGGSLSAGTYQYTVTYEWLDRKGQKHRSATSIGQQSSPGVNGKVTLTIPTLRLTRKVGVVISIYRTIANGTVPYKITSDQSPLFNNLAVDTVTYVDTAADSTISANEILYTSGGVLDNDAPPAATVIDVNKNRCLLAGLEDGLEFAYSKQSIKDEAIAFSDFLRFRVDPLGGPITAIKFLDDKIIIFKNSYIFYVSGQGPDDTGANNDFSEPIFVTADVGCPYPKSIVLTPVGLMFMSAKGIYLLDRSLAAHYIGAEVEAYNTQNFTSATLLEDKNQVRFLTDSGLTLLYDYYYGQWSTFTNHEGQGSGFWFNKGYVYSRNDGNVYLENTITYLDDSLQYALKIRTAWIKLSSIQNFQRIKRANILGDFLSAHKLRIQVAYDYEDFFVDNFFFDPTVAGLGTNVYGQDGVTYGGDMVYGGNASGVYQFQIHLRRQKCESIQLEFDDIENPTSGPGYSLSDLSFICGIKSGLMKLPASKRIG